MGQMCMTDAGTTQDNFILPAPNVGGLPISQDRLDRMKLVRNRTLLIMLPSGNNILVNMVFKISVGPFSIKHSYCVRRNITKQWCSKVPKSGGAHRHVIFVPSVKNQYKRVVFGCMVI